MDLDGQIKLGHLLLQDRKCRTCGEIKNLVDIPIVANSSSTPRIQEAHRTIYHIICELVEKSFL